VGVRGKCVVSLQATFFRLPTGSSQQSTFCEKPTLKLIKIEFLETTQANEYTSINNSRHSS